MEKMKIHYDTQEKIVNKRWNICLGILSIISIVLIANFVSLQYSFISIFVAGFLYKSEWPNYILLNHIVCPECKKKYFAPFFADKEDIKKLLKSNPKCVSCNYEAEIISEYKHMY